MIPVHLEWAGIGSVRWLARPGTTGQRGRGHDWPSNEGSDGGVTKAVDKGEPTSTEDKVVVRSPRCAHCMLVTPHHPWSLIRFVPLGGGTRWHFHTHRAASLLLFGSHSQLRVRAARREKCSARAAAPRRTSKRLPPPMRADVGGSAGVTAAATAAIAASTAAAPDCCAARR